MKVDVQAVGICPKTFRPVYYCKVSFPIDEIDQFERKFNEDRKKLEWKNQRSELNR